MQELYDTNFSALIKRHQIAANQHQQSRFFFYEGARVEVLPNESFKNIVDRYIKGKLTNYQKKQNNVKALITWLEN